ncbi:MAG: UDP-N-acetylglucosamine 2-epimerase [Firmicutes bacterium ADurb.Bin506]|jgi:UDP-N-acetylglucosamine 2-epimerase (non-hydrolysing)|nr:MAG: UDP-N-acetylglucosamine 2-epimerase [Firmicutes bacterium ADurb.Bin506]
MRNTKKVMSVFGTRPDTIKLAPVVLELNNRPEFVHSVTVGTAQHREMMDQVLDVFGIRADYDLGIMQEDQTLFDIVERGLPRMKAVLEAERPDLVLVHGDTSTAFVGALSAFYMQIPVGHVEAGLRTDCRYDPFPEEMNRRLVGTIAELHFAPTAQYRANLIRENVDSNRIYVTGNTVVDAVLATAATRTQFENPVLQKMDLSGRRLVLVTAHRRENIGEPLKNICGAVADVLRLHPDLVAVMPVHPNPRVRSVVTAMLGSVDRCLLVEPLSYPDMVGLMERSYLVMSDSGGLQEEAPAFGVPVLVLRRTTERPEGIEAGTLRLAGVDRATIVEMACAILDSPDQHEAMSRARNPFGDGRASVRTVDAIMHYFGMLPKRPNDFMPA